MPELSFFLLPLTGVVVGFIITFSGGGAALYLPLLMFGFDMTLKEAVPISLATMVVTSLFGLVSHHKQKNIHIRGGLLAIAGALLGTALGSYLSGIASDLVLEKAFGILMLVMVFPMYLEGRDRKKKDPAKEINREIQVLEHPFKQKWYIPVAIFLIGMASGTTVGLFGVSGVVSLVVGFYLIGIKPKIIVGTSIFILFFKASSALAWHLTTTSLNWEIVFLLGAGASFGAFIAPLILSKLHQEKAENMLEKIFMGLVLFIGILFLVKGV